MGQGLTSIVIATFDLIATGTGGSSATITADILNAIGGNETFGMPSTNLDALLTDPSNFRSVSLAISDVAAVPEPATLALGSMTLLAGGVAAWRRRHSRRNLDIAA